MKQKKKKECPVSLYPEKCTGCRTCQLRCSIRNSGEFNPSLSYIAVNRDHGVRTMELKFTDDCTWCGYCAKFCAYGAMELKKNARGAEEGV